MGRARIAVTAAGYIKVLGHRGVPRMVGAFLAIGIAGTMTPVAFVLFARAATHSFASASLVLAASTVGGLVLGPFRGRLVDRRGARAAVLLLAIPDVATIDEVAHPAHKAEAFTWLGTLYGTGLALGAALAGQLITTTGTRAALAIATGATLLAWLLTTTRAGTLHQPSVIAPPGPTGH